MQRILVLFPIVGVCLAVGAAVAGEDPAPTPAAVPPVRVRLASLGAPRQLTIRATGPITVTDPGGGNSGASAECVVQVTASGKLVCCGSQKAATLRLEGPGLTVTSGKLKRSYPGALLITASGGGLSLVNECSLESYTAGVLAGECPSLFHPQAIRAMAVAARSYSYRKAFLSRMELCDTVHCQVYRGSTGIHAPIEAAVRDTDGQVAIYDGEVIDAVYSSDCGGYTEASEDAWRGGKPVPYLRAVEDAPEPQGDPYCKVNRSHTWKLALSRARLRTLFGRGGEPELEVLDVTDSGRVRRLQLSAPAPAGDAASGDAPARARVFSGEEWRKLLGLSAVKSLRFDVVPTDTGVELVGHGYGHGVGLCQFGANGMAKQGGSWAEIVRHYYTGVEIGPPPAIVARPAAAGRKRMAKGQN